MKVGILTGGGDCPGLNAVIRAVTRKALDVYGYQVLGILEGWLGLLEKKTVLLTHRDISGILHRGGTILKTSRTNPLQSPKHVRDSFQNLKELDVDALVVIGGEDTLGVAGELFKRGVNVVGVPKTIDNDLYGTDFTFGFDTAVNVATEAIDRLHTTAESHNRVMIVEVMGRHTGWIAVQAGLAGGADVILIPEKPPDLDEVCESIKKRHKKGKDFSIVVVGEGTKLPTLKNENGIYVVRDEEKDAFGHVHLGGIGNVLGREIHQRTGFDTRVTILGYLQRGGSPTAFDRVLATRYGIAAIDLVKEGNFGKMVALRGNKIVAVDLAMATKKIKKVDENLYRIAQVFFG
ncbi:6-phosphofructokinase [bacterium]|nr:6-phosphofructokinase [bacterium]